MRVRDIVAKWKVPNDGTRTIMESIMVPEVGLAFNAWIKQIPKGNFVLIGGLALSFHGIVRSTEDVDCLYLSGNVIPEEVVGFNHHRKSAFEHKRTGVEIETVYPEMFPRISSSLVQQVFNTAINHDGVLIASKSGIVALKAQAMRTGAKGARDRSDIMELLELGDIDVSGYDISEDAVKYIDHLRNELTAPHPFEKR